MRYRLGDLFPSGNDKWWRIQNENDAYKAVEDISKKLRKYAIPKFDEFQNVSDIINLWHKGISPGLTDYEVKTYLKKLNAHVKK